MKKIIAVTLFTALALTSVFGAAKKSKDLVKIGVTGAIYEDVWAPAIKNLSKKGINVKLVQFSDYVAPSRALEDGDIDLHACLSRVFFEAEVKSHGYHLQRVANTLYEPLKVYSLKVKSVEELKTGDIIAIPNEATNEGRALKLLNSVGIIKLRDNAGFNPTLDDIEDIPTGVKLQQLASNLIPSALVDVTAAVINGNYALDFGIDQKTAIATELYPDTPYWNLIAARTADLSDKKRVKLFDEIAKEFQTDATAKVFDEKFSGAMRAVGWDIDELKEYK